MLAEASKLRIVRSPNLKQIYGQDLPTLPEHWHKGNCRCVPTVAYIRISKINRKLKATIKSPMIQFDEIWRDAKQNGRRIVEIVFDLNVSGKDFDRQALNEVIEGIKVGRYEHVSVWKWSRWGRNLKASLNMLEEVEACGARVDSATESFDRDTLMGEFGVNSMLMFADFQSKQIGQVWRSVHKLRIENQLPHNGRKRFGYDYDDADERNKHFELNDAESQILEWAYDEYISGTGTREIAKEFNSQGFRTEFDGLWTYQAVGKTLDTGFGAGLLRMRSDEKKRQARLNKKIYANTLASYDVWLPGKQEPVIDLSVWLRYKEKRTNQAKLPPRSRRAVHAFSTLVFCGICSMRMQTHYGGPKRQHRWQCPSYSTFHPGKTVSVSNDDLVTLVREWLAGKAQGDWVEKEAEKVLERKAAKKADLTADEKDLAKIEKTLDNLMRLYEASEDPDSPTTVRTWRRMNELEGEAAVIRARLKAAKSQSVAEPNFIAMGQVHENWDRFGPETHNAALRQSLGMILVSPPSQPRIRSELRSRVKIVPLWEKSDWDDWFAARRQKSA